MEVNLRIAEKSDYEILKKMYVSFIENMNKFNPSDCNMDEEVDKWINNAINRQFSIIYIAEFEKQTIGFTRLQKKERIDKEYRLINYLKLSDLFVYNAFRNKGVATKLLNQAENWGKENEAIEIVLNVYEANTNAKALYQKNGYQKNESISLNRIRMVKVLLGNQH